MRNDMIHVGGNGNTHAAPIAYKGDRVMTTDRLAEAYGVEAKHIQDNHANNRARFVEGVHLYKIVGAELKALREQPDFIGLQISPMVRHLILWTERGARRHAKILDNDMAWSVFEDLEDTYFAAKGELKTDPLREGQYGAQAVPVISAARVAPVFKDYFSICRLIGMDKNQAALGASRATHKLTGINPLEMVGAQQLEAPQHAPHITATQVGQKVGDRTGASAMSPRAANKALEKYGFQAKDPYTDGGWNCTDKGRPHAVWVDTNRKHSDGAPVRQLRWSETVVDALIAAMSEPPAAETNDHVQH